MVQPVCWQTASSNFIDFLLLPCVVWALATSPGRILRKVVCLGKHEQTRIFWLNDFRPFRFPDVHQPSIWMQWATVLLIIHVISSSNVHTPLQIKLCWTCQCLVTVKLWLSQTNDKSFSLYIPQYRISLIIWTQCLFIRCSTWFNKLSSKEELYFG